MERKGFIRGLIVGAFSAPVLIHELHAAAKLHFLVSASVTGYIQQLNERMPDIRNILGKHFLKFKHFRFEIINSDINTISKHQIAINFYSEPLEWYDTIDHYLLVSDKNQTGDEMFTHLFQLQPFLNIHTLKENHETIISKDLFKCAARHDRQ